MDLGLKNRVAVVAASSKGLGKAVAVGLAAEGAKLACATFCERECGAGWAWRGAGAGIRSAAARSAGAPGADSSRSSSRRSRNSSLSGAAAAARW